MRRSNGDVSAEGVAAIEGALGPALNFNALQINKSEGRLRRPGLINSVDEEADGCVGIDVNAFCPRAADRRPRVDTGTSEGEAGHQAFQARNVRNTLFRNLFCAEGRDRDRHHLQIFLAALRRDNHFFDRGGGIGLSRSGGKRGADRDERRGAHQQACAQTEHNFPPMAPTLAIPKLNRTENDFECNRRFGR